MQEIVNFMKAKIRPSEDMAYLEREFRETNTGSLRAAAVHEAEGALGLGRRSRSRGRGARYVRDSPASATQVQRCSLPRRKNADESLRVRHLGGGSRPPGAPVGGDPRHPYVAIGVVPRRAAQILKALVREMRFPRVLHAVAAELEMLVLR
jgi:hypothetical protein